MAIPYPRHRVHVFWNDGHGPRSWTWCREIDGEVYDHFSGLPLCDSHADALAKALAWLRSKTKAPAAPVSPSA